MLTKTLLIGQNRLLHVQSTAVLIPFLIIGVFDQHPTVILKKIQKTTLPFTQAKKQTKKKNKNFVNKTEDFYGLLNR